MTEQQAFVAFSRAFLLVLEETFEKVHGIYLDKETSVFETLATVNAEEASYSPCSECASIAAHVAHMTYYLEILIRFINNEQPQVDWQHIWKSVREVTPQEWDASKAALRDAHQRIKHIAETTTDWNDDGKIGGAIGMLMHNAYHLGEIRRILCTLRSSSSLQ